MTRKSQKFFAMRTGCAARTVSEIARRLLVLASLILVLSACGSTKTVTVTVKAQAPPAAKVSPLVAEGAHYFNQFACAQCHGAQRRWRHRVVGAGAEDHR
jgi:mono/diheme cytochrome c family protein